MSSRSTASPVTFELVLGQLRRRDFAVLSTATEEGAPHSAGVVYGVSAPGRALAIYVMTRKHLKKVRNIEHDPRVSLVIPVTRRILWFEPPPSIQLRGSAEVLDWRDEGGVESFRRFWMGRRILRMYEEFYRRGERRICFLKIAPVPVISTYMVGHSVWGLSKRMESGMGEVVIPAEYRSAAVC